MKQHDDTNGVDLVGCSGQPATPQHGENCNPVHGDTTCSATLPVLCIKKRKLPQPDALPACASQGSCGWSGGELSLTPALQGCLLTSLARANELCETYAGSGYVMSSFHDGRDGGGNGFGFFGKSDLLRNISGSRSRFWVGISDQNANCWNARGAIN